MMNAETKVIKSGFGLLKSVEHFNHVNRACKRMGTSPVNVILPAASISFNTLT